MEVAFKMAKVTGNLHGEEEVIVAMVRQWEGEDAAHIAGMIVDALAVEENLAKVFLLLGVPSAFRHACAKAIKDHFGFKFIGIGNTLQDAEVYSGRGFSRLKAGEAFVPVELIG